MKRPILLLALCASLIAAAATAAPITYTYTGSATGTVNGTGFTNQTYTFTATGDTTTVTHPTPDEYYNVMTAATITIAGTACSAGCTVSSPGSYYVSDTSTAIVRGPKQTASLTHDYMFEGCFGSFCAGSGSYAHHDLASSFGPEVSGDEGGYTPYITYATSGGNVNFSGLDSHITYSAATEATNVPTLSQWGLILLGAAFAVAGIVALRNHA